MAVLAEPTSTMPPRQLRQAGIGFLPQSPSFRAARCLCAYPVPSPHSRSPQPGTAIILPPRSRLAHGVGLLLETPSREVWCEEGRQTDICGVTFTDRQIIARRKPHALRLSSSDWTQTQPDAVTVVSQRPSGRQSLHSSCYCLEGLSAQHLTLLRPLRAKRCHSPMRELFQRRGSPPLRRSQGTLEEPRFPPPPSAASQEDRVEQAVLGRGEANIPQGRDREPLGFQESRKGHTQTPTMYSRARKKAPESERLGGETQSAAEERGRSRSVLAAMGVQRPDPAPHGLPGNEQKAHTVILRCQLAAASDWRPFTNSRSVSQPPTQPGGVGS